MTIKWFIGIDTMNCYYCSSKCAHKAKNLQSPKWYERRNVCLKILSLINKQSRRLYCTFLSFINALGCVIFFLPQRLRVVSFIFLILNVPTYGSFTHTCMKQFEHEIKTIKQWTWMRLRDANILLFDIKLTYYCYFYAMFEQSRRMRIEIWFLCCVCVFFFTFDWRLLLAKRKLMEWWRQSYRLQAL